MTDFMRAYRLDERKEKKQKQKFILGEWRECQLNPKESAVVEDTELRMCIMNVKHRTSRKL